VSFMMLQPSLTEVYRDINFPFIPILNLKLLYNDVFWPRHVVVPERRTQELTFKNPNVAFYIFFQQI
jgi:hypothetical protein